MLERKTVVSLWKGHTGALPWRVQAREDGVQTCVSDGASWLLCRSRVVSEEVESGQAVCLEAMLLASPPITSAPSWRALPTVTMGDSADVSHFLAPTHTHTHTPPTLNTTVEMNCLEKNHQLSGGHSGCPAVCNFCGSPTPGAFVPRE